MPLFRWTSLMGLRRTGIKRGSSQLRRKPMKRANPERREKRYARDFGERAVAVREMPCWVCGIDGPSDPHHEPSRARGGTRRDMVPLCRRCHDARHSGGFDRGQIGLLEVWAGDVATELDSRGFE